MKYRNLTLVGTSHVARQSVNDVKRTIKEGKPGLVAIELDDRRYQALTSTKKHKRKLSDMFRVGVKGYLFSVLGEWVEKKLGDYTGVPPGSDMLTAVKLAKERKIRVSLIDQDIAITLKRLSKGLSWREKFRFLGDLLGAPFKRKKIKFDLNNVPSEEIMKELMGEVKKKYPNVYRVLITERNEVMAHNLFKLMHQYKDEEIIAVVGAGHEKEIIALIKKKFARLENSSK